MFSLDCLAKIRESVCCVAIFELVASWNAASERCCCNFSGVQVRNPWKGGEINGRGKSKNISSSRLLQCCLQTYGAPPALAEKKRTLWKLPLEQYINYLGQTHHMPCVCVYNEQCVSGKQFFIAVFFPPPALPLRRLEVIRREEE